MAPWAAPNAAKTSKELQVIQFNGSTMGNTDMMQFRHWSFGLLLL